VLVWFPPDRRVVWTNEGSKRAIPRKDVPFGDLNDVPPNFGSQTPKMKFWAHENDFQAWTTKIQILIT